MAHQEQLLKVVDPAKFKIDHADYSGKTKPDARKAIKKLLEKYKLAVCPEPITADRVYSGGDTRGKAIIAGTTWVRCFTDGTDNTGAIKFGKPVVFDTVKGFGVTGINDKWAEDEYYILGKALQDYAGPGEDKIIMQFVEQVPHKGEIIAKCKIDPAAGGRYPVFQDWTEADTGADQQKCIWSFELPKSIVFKDTSDNIYLKDSGNNKWEGAGQYVKAFNLTRQYVMKNALCHLFPSGNDAVQYYFSYSMPQTFYGKLDADLKQGDFALATVDGDHTAGIEGSKMRVYDKMLSSVNSISSKLKSGTKILATLTQKNTNTDFVWRLVVQQADACPIRQ
jgi:hypothetical protein